MIPGLTDGHIHGIRAAQTFASEVNWIGVPSLQQALEKIRMAAQTQKPGSWIVVAGSWTEEQFAERRRPTAAEVEAAAPDNPVYIQHLYDWLLLTPKAMEALNIHDDADVTPGEDLEPLLERFFADKSVAYIHVHYARRGCYAARVERAA